MVIKHKLSGYKPIFEYWDGDARLGNTINVFVTPTQDKFEIGQVDAYNRKLRLTEFQAQAARNEVAQEGDGKIKTLTKYLKVNGFKPIPE